VADFWSTRADDVAAYWVRWHPLVGNLERAVAALESGRSSWTTPLGVVRPALGDDAASVTADRLRTVIGYLIVAGHWVPGIPDIWIVADADNDACSSRASVPPPEGGMSGQSIETLRPGPADRPERFDPAGP